MAKLDDLFSQNELLLDVSDGYVRWQDHPTEPLRIYNYTQKAQFDRHWNDVTTQCRGLIVRHDGEIVSRPFPKFFNYGEHVDVNLPHFAPAVVTEKVDGSLGILYPTSDGWSVATRGSFTSDQALHATKLLNTRYASTLRRLSSAYTWLTEIVYPENRIVVDYGTRDDLFLLDVVDTDTGKSVAQRMWSVWPGPVTETHHFKAWRDALTVQRENKEGFVVHFPDTGLRVKIKHDEYVRLHRIITNVSSKTVWEHLANDLPMTDLIDNVPDEFFDWLSGTIADLNLQAFQRKQAAFTEFKRVCGAASIGWTTDKGVPRAWGPVPSYARKKFAEMTTTSSPHLRPLLFNVLDNRSIDKAIWKQLKPEYSRPFHVATEDAA